MVALYATCLIVLFNSLCLFSMEQPSGFLVPLNQTLLSWRQFVNSDNPSEISDNSSEKIELLPLNQHGQQKHQESLCNTLVPFNNDRMYDVYKQVVSFRQCKTPRYKDLLQCINECNYVKRFGVNEDCMGRFAFSQNNDDQQTALFFYLLKHYNNQAAITREVPPQIWSSLAERFNLVDGGCDVIRVLIHDTNKLLFDKIPHYHNFISCIHSNEKFDQFSRKYLQESVVCFDKDWKKKFVCDVGDMLCSLEPYKVLRGIIIMINEAKRLSLLQKEHDLGDYVLNHYKYDSQVGKIALLCLCIADYNSAAAGKMVPSPCLYFAYKAMESLHILLPDAFDKDLLNPEKIAFAEYDKLLDDIHEIKEAYDGAVEYCVRGKYSL
jgi:hypothetical protein